MTAHRVEQLAGGVSGVSVVLAVRDKRTGRLEHEVFGSAPFAEVPLSPYYRPRPGFWLSTRAWMDEDGQHVVLAHDCRETREVHILAWPTWQAVNGELTPSYSCDRCGLHCFPQIDAEEIRP